MTYTDFVDHLVFRVSTLEVTERFYAALLLQPPERAVDSRMYQVGHTRLFFTSVAGRQTRTHDKEQVGLNHVASGVRTIEDLESIQAQLSDQLIAHSGIVLDQYGLNEFIWLDDPDGIRVEFYLRTA